jgi:hypothetical protein
MGCEDVSGASWRSKASHPGAAALTLSAKIIARFAPDGSSTARFAWVFNAPPQNGQPPS